MRTWFWELAAVVQLRGRWISAELSVMKVNLDDSSCLLAIDMGGNSLMTHNTKAEGTDEPRKENRHLIINFDNGGLLFQKGAITRSIKGLLHAYLPGFKAHFSQYISFFHTISIIQERLNEGSYSHQIYACRLSDEVEFLSKCTWNIFYMDGKALSYLEQILEN